MKALLSTFLICFFLAFFDAKSQESLDFQQLKGENLSTQSITYAIQQDKLGNVWIASEEGVLKHNSKFYKIYNTYNGLPESLNNRINTILVDSGQRIWIGLERGVCLFNKKKDRFELIKSEQSLNPSLITCFIEDSNLNIWVAAFNGLWKINYEDNTLKRIIAGQNILALECHKDRVYFSTPKGLSSIKHDGTDMTLLSDSNTLKDITAIKASKESLFLGTSKGEILKLNINNFTIKSVNLSEKSSTTIKDIEVDHKNNIYVATDGAGLFYLDDYFNVLNNYKEHPDNPSSISSNGIYDIEIGKEGILWLATYGGGINFYNAGKLPFKNIKHELNNPNSLKIDFTRAIAKDSKGKLWFGTKNGLSILNKKNNTWKHIGKLSDQSIYEDIVLSIHPDDNYMWVGTYNNGLYKINIDNYNVQTLNVKAEDKFVKKIYSIYKDKKSNLWFGGISGQLTVIKKDQKLDFYPISNIKHITEDLHGNILASGRNGVYRIKYDKKEFELIDILKPDKDKLAYTTVNSVNVFDNQLIVATSGSGILFYNAQNNRINKIDVSRGMPSDIVHAVMPSGKSSFWASTSKGLAKIAFRKQDTIIHVFDKNDGLSSTEFNYGSFLKLSDSLFVFGGTDGVTMFNPFKIKEKKENPFVVFDNFKLFNKPIHPGTELLPYHINETQAIELKSNQNSIEIDFTGILHNTSSHVTYSWKLEGFNDKWSTPSTNDFATFTNLNSGAYVFKVKAANKFGFFGPEKQLKININAPWWVSNKAIFTYFLLAVALFYLAYHLTSIMIKKKNADQQINFYNNITHELKTPLTLLMSSLENITESIEDNKDSNKRIKTTVKRINSLFGQMLNFHKVTSQDELLQDILPLNLEDYINQIINNFKPLTQEKNIEITFTNNWLNHPFYFDKDTLDKIFYNLLSNAIKYSKEGGKIYVRVNNNQLKQLELEIEDFGIGIPKDQQKFILKQSYRARNVINSQREGTGLGLMIVKKLVEKTYGEISFKSEENKRTIFKIKLRNFYEKFEQQKLSVQNIIDNAEQSSEIYEEIEEFSDSKILIVEDNDELKGQLVKIIGTYFQVFEASNGKEGLEVASQIFPDIILTDLIMPELDGLQMAKQLKEDINLNHIPVFMLTVLQNSKQKIESLESGISEYLEKPINIKILLVKMINTLKWQKKLRQKYVHESDTENAYLYRNKNDQEFLLKLEDNILENINNNNFSVHDLSGNMGMSRTSLYMKLKNLVDLSPQDFIIHTRLKHAKKLLVKGGMSIKEVAYSSGFSNPKYFSTSFKKYYGQSPSKFLDSLE